MYIAQCTTSLIPDYEMTTSVEVEKRKFDICAKIVSLKFVSHVRWFTRYGGYLWSMKKEYRWNDALKLNEFSFSISVKMLKEFTLYGNNVRGISYEIGKRLSLFDSAKKTDKNDMSFENRIRISYIHWLRKIKSGTFTLMLTRVLTIISSSS